MNQPLTPPAPLPPPDPADAAAAQTALLARLVESSAQVPTHEALQWEVQTLAQIVLDLRARLRALEARQERHSNGE